ncbi:MAG: hypothetical protein AAF799_36240 [Myxococcota bacterium]
MIRAFALALVALLAVVPGCKKAEAVHIAYSQLFAAGDQLLLVGSVPDELTGYRELNRIALVGTDGAVRKSVDERNAFHVAGVTSDVVWLSRGTAPPGLEARALDTLAPQPGIADALKGHDALAATYDVIGIQDGRAVLDGPDGKRYSVDRSGAIAPLAGDAEVRPKPSKRVPARDETVLGTDPPSVLVFGSDFQGGAPVETLSREDANGTTAWTTAVTELAAPVGIDEAKVSLVGTARLGESVWLVTRASRTTRRDQQDYYEVEHRLVRLDPATGRATESHLIQN